MGLNKFSPKPSGRMATIQTLSTINNSAVIEFGTMGHMVYAYGSLARIADCDKITNLFSTHINEVEITLGNFSRLKNAIKQIIKEENPQAVFIVPSAIMQVVGMDLSILVNELQDEYEDIPIILFDISMGANQNRSISETLYLLVKELSVQTIKSSAKKFNIIGSCVDMYRYEADLNEIKRLLKGAFNIEPCCILTSNCSVQDIKNISLANINLVLRYEGIKTAEYLKKNYKTPFLYGTPYGVKGTITWLKDIEKILDIKINNDFLETGIKKVEKNISFSQNVVKYNQDKEYSKIYLSGHYDTIKGILNFACDEIGIKKGVCWCDDIAIKGFSDNDIPYMDEEEWTKFITPQFNGLLMASEEILNYANKSISMQIATPCLTWRITNPYEHPYMGFKGAMNLVLLWTNEIFDKSMKEV